MTLLNIEEYRQEARRRLPRFIFDYLDGGAEDEIALKENRSAFEAIKLTPRPLNDVSVRDQSVDWFGQSLPMPIVIAPTGLNGLYRRDGDILLARAASRLGIPFTLSTASNNSIEQVARASNGDLWFQLYVMNRDFADQLVDRALAADFSHLVLTVDVAMGGKRERDERNKFVMPFRIRPKTIADVLRHPRWLWNVGRHGAPSMANLATETVTDPNTQAALLSRKMDASFDWDDLKRLRDRWPRRLLVKGLLHPDDAERAVGLGVDAVVVSNHGGRQLDIAPATIDVLPRFSNISAPILVDSGIRRGSDIVKALSLGASAVMIGRAALFGLVVGGEQGIVDVIELLRREIDRTQALLGAKKFVLSARHR
ncbi:(S)-mandelate dehydrogenase [Agrobacterium pusense]|uniref:alpha-hydroxy-acid oxidizing protein n=1 Tax=Agrobacterium pusense TaxID=648995 RepID=UPI002863EB0A|nr:alpha-hydroxy-acid oxidizing protein [Agrobacterium pusense]MDR6192503.1 (S)-mandelate dehydrogenase [Agrobacterium pusense]